MFLLLQIFTDGFYLLLYYYRKPDVKKHLLSLFSKTLSLSHMHFSSILIKLSEDEI